MFIFYDVQSDAFRSIRDNRVVPFSTIKSRLSVRYPTIHFGGSYENDLKVWMANTKYVLKL